MGGIDLRKSYGHMNLMTLESFLDAASAIDHVLSGREATAFKHWRNKIGAAQLRAIQRLRA
jgi:hypothetical protein